MKSPNIGLLLCLILAVGWQLVPVRADEESVDVRPTDSAKLQVISYSSGLTGFYEPSSKKLYVYSSDLKTPYITVQVQTLGEPLKVIKGPSQPGQVPAPPNQAD